MAENNNALKTLSSTSEMPTPAAFQTMIETIQHSNDELVAQAPSEIEDDVKVVVVAQGDYYQVLVEAAADRIKAYVKKTCGVDLTVPGSGTISTPNWRHGMLPRPATRTQLARPDLRIVE